MIPTPKIPDYWSPEQALAVFEFLDALRDRVWEHYHRQIIAQFRAECQAEDRNEQQLELFSLDDEIPF